MKYKETTDTAEMIFPNGNYLKVYYKHVRDTHFTFHYWMKNANGTMKIKPCWMPEYDDVMGMMEGGMSESFFPIILKYLYNEDISRRDSYKYAIEMYDTGKVNELQDPNWPAETRINELRKLYEWELKIIEELEEMVLWDYFNKL